jgi:hypothetical protein
VSATAVLKEARAAGIRVAVDGRDLVLEAATPPPEPILAALRQHKAEIVRLLSGEEGWTAEDWRAYFEERAAVREYDGGLTRAEAERLALEDTVDLWLACHPAAPTSDQAGCAHCGRRERDGDALLPILARDGHTWVHDGCWAAWHQRRRKQARAALEGMGLTAHQGSETHSRT